MRDERLFTEVLRETADAAWLLATTGDDELRETSIGSRFAISNGFLGVRGGRALNRAAGDLGSARTYVAGLFDTATPTTISPGLVQAADWLQVRLSTPQGALVRRREGPVSQRRTLDMKRGVVLSGTWFEAPGPGESSVRIRARTLRLVSLHARAIGLRLLELDVDAGVVDLTLDAVVDDTDPDLVSDRLLPNLGVWRTRRPGGGLALATTCSLSIDGLDVTPTRVGPLASSWTWRTQPGQIVGFSRLVGVARSTTDVEQAAAEATRELRGAGALGWRRILADHESAWADRWNLGDVAIEGDVDARRALRFALYHLNSAVNPDDERVSVAARALTGDDYRGHVFWDTEIYLLPYYTMTWPGAARSLLMYRYHTLAGARAKAAGMGWRGALYAWESADTGEETTPEQVIGPDRRVVDVLSGKQEQHISADVAHAVWQYWRATGDEAFMLEAGAEILLETGRFWASRAKLEAEGRRHIRGVIGPDEYHEDIDDSAFTNVMARWNIRRAVEVVTLLRAHWPDRWASLSLSLGLDDAELADWKAAGDTMVISLDPATGIFEQFAGFNGLEQIDLSQYAGRSVPMDVVLGRERTRKTQVIKQADVVALLVLLPEAFPGDRAMKNFQFYEPRCSHGSSLSRVMHGVAAARLGLVDKALGFFQETAAIDLGDAHVAIDGGVHIGALGGMWMMAVLGFGGLSMTDIGLALDPHLPAAWRSLRFGVQWRGRSVRLHIAHAERRIEASLEAGDPMTLTVGGRDHPLQSAEPLAIPFPDPDDGKPR